MILNRVINDLEVVGQDRINTVINIGTSLFPDVAPEQVAGQSIVFVLVRLW